MKLWSWKKEELPSISHAIRTAVAATLSVVIARLVGMPEAYWAAIFLLGILSLAFRLEKTAYRYASVTLTIIVLIPRVNAPWIVAAHRFIEVSVGILVALAFVAIWREERIVPDATTE